LYRLHISKRIGTASDPNHQPPQSIDAKSWHLQTHTQIYQRLRQLFPELPTRYIDSAICKCLESFEGSLPLSYPWANSTIAFVPSEANIGGSSVG